MACRRRLAALPAKRSHCVVPASMRQLNHSPPPCVHMPRTGNGGRVHPPSGGAVARPCGADLSCPAAPVGLGRPAEAGKRRRRPPLPGKEITPRRRHRRLRGALALPRARGTASVSRAACHQGDTQQHRVTLSQRRRCTAPPAFSRGSCAADRRAEDAGANARFPAFDHAKRCQASGCAGCCGDVRRGPAARAVQTVPSKRHARDCFSLSMQAFRMP